MRLGQRGRRAGKDCSIKWHNPQEIAVDAADAFARLIAPVERQMFNVVWRVLRHPQNQATAVVMRFIEQESHATIAAALGCGTETVKEHLARGRKRLGEILGSLAPRVNTFPCLQDESCAEERI
jgi:hypothetical protein